jgi:hypothetical protein
VAGCAGLLLPHPRPIRRDQPADRRLPPAHLPLQEESQEQNKHHGTPLYTDKKEDQIFFMYKEIKNGAVAKEYMTNGLLIYGEIFAHFLIY